MEIQKSQKIRTLSIPFLKDQPKSPEHTANFDMNEAFAPELNLQSVRDSQFYTVSLSALTP